MSDQPRALPDRPNLRYLKVEAKRRLSTGEFATLHAAQLAIAREYGFSSWTTLKEAIEAASGRSSHALAHVRWVVARFQGADGPGWVAPDNAELRQHFDDHYLTLVPTETLTGTPLARAAVQLRQDLVVSHATPDRVRAQVADLRSRPRPSPPRRAG